MSTLALSDEPRHDGARADRKTWAERFANLRIRTRMYLGFGVVLGILVLVAIAGVLQLSTVNHEIEEYAELADEVKLVEASEIAFLKYVVETKNYLLTLDTTVAADAQTHGRKVSEKPHCRH